MFLTQKLHVPCLNAPEHLLSFPSAMLHNIHPFIQVRFKNSFTLSSLQTLPSLSNLAFSFPGFYDFDFQIGEQEQSEYPPLAIVNQIVSVVRRS